MNFTLFTVGKTRVRLNALFFVPALLAFISGNGPLFLLTFFALSLHEAAHAAMTYACGIGIAEIGIHPLGFRAKLGAGARTVGDELAIAAAGPIFSLTAGVAASLVYHSGLMTSETLRLFGSVNTVLALFNLLPAPPLDGGALIGAVIESRASARAARRTLGVLGLVTAALLAGASALLYLRGASFIPVGAAAVFLAIAGAQELFMARRGRADAMLKRRAALADAHGVRVREVALRGDVAAAEALRFAASGFYTRFVVLGADLKELGTLSEQDLYEGMAHAGREVTLQALLRASIDQRRGG